MSTTPSAPSTPGITLAPEPILALRVWHVVYDNKLRSVTRTELVWPVNNALKCTCMLGPNGCNGESGRESGREPDTLLPHAHGQCGIYGVSGGAITLIARDNTFSSGYAEQAFYYNYHLDALIHQLTKYWVGIVALWGRVIYGRNGVYRAEYGYPVALFEADGAPEVAENYGILVLPLPSSVDELPGTFEQARSLLKERR